MKELNHSQLVELAAKWLRRKHSIVITEMTGGGAEEADASGKGKNLYIPGGWKDCHQCGGLGTIDTQNDYEYWLRRKKELAIEYENKRKELIAIKQQQKICKSELKRF